jgi:hypothetical protein
MLDDPWRLLRAEVAVKWRLEFYSERRRTLACYTVEALTAAAALALGRTALRTEYPRAVRRTRSLFEQAERVGGQDADGWVLYRIANGRYTG